MRIVFVAQELRATCDGYMVTISRCDDTDVPTWWPVIWDLARAGCPRHSDQITPEKMMFFFSESQARNWCEEKLDELQKERE